MRFNIVAVDRVNGDITNPIISSDVRKLRCDMLDERTMIANEHDQVGAGIFTAYPVVLSCIGINIVAADQYIAIVLPGKMYKAEFEKRNLAPKNLSRIIEDSGTLTSPLVPWNTCGAYMAATLGVATLVYLPFVFFNLINPVVSVIYGYTGFTIRKIEEAPESAVLA